MPGVSLVKNVFTFICGLFSRCSVMCQKWQLHSLPMPIIHSNRYRNSVIVIDASPSMEEKDWHPSRLDAAKESAKAFIRRLLEQEPSARVAVVSYNKIALIIAELTPVQKHWHLFRSIDSIKTNIPATNITSGLNATYSILRFRRGDNQVILLSDGFHNFGPNPCQSSDKLKEIAIIETVGIAGTPKTVDEKTMKYCASARANGSKRYRWIGQKEQLVEHFRDLAGRLTRA